MKVWLMMSLTGFPIHSNYDTKEATKFRHAYILLQTLAFSLDTVARFWLNA